MNKLIAALAIMLFIVPCAFAQDTTATEPSIKDFTKMEIGALLTSPHNTPLGQEQKISIVPSFMLKQTIIQNLFTLAVLETNLGTGYSDTTAFKFGFGYELPGLDLFTYKDKPVTMTVDLLLAKDIVTEWDKNAVVGMGIKIDRNKLNNIALMLRGFWNHTEITDPAGVTSWDNVFSFAVAAEWGIQ